MAMESAEYFVKISLHSTAYSIPIRPGNFLHRKFMTVENNFLLLYRDKRTNVT